MKFRGSALVFLSAMIFLVWSGICSAEATPKFGLIPLTPTTLVVPANGGAIVNYRVTNNTAITRTLTTVPITGVTQISSGSGLCSRPFTLAQGQSCILSLSINGLQSGSRILSGPVVCKTKSDTDTSPSLFLCSQPAKVDELNVTVSGTSAVNISVTGSPLSIAAGSVVPGFLTVTNNSTSVISYNIRATLPAGWNDVTQDASGCATLLPGRSCSLKFFAGATPHVATAVSIAGSNTNVVPAVIEITGGQIAFNAGFILVLQVNDFVPKTLVLRNNSPTYPATNISATLPAGWTNIAQDSSDCNFVAPGATCNLVFTVQAGAVAHPFAIVPIKGTNTNQIRAIMAVEPSGSATLEITGSPLHLIPGGGTGSLTVTNLSATTTATAITSDFTATALNGNVTETGNTCAVLNPGASCTLTYTSGNNFVPQTNFNITGTAAVTTQAAIAIGVTIGDSFQGGTVSCLVSQGQAFNLIASTTDNAGFSYWDFNYPSSLIPNANSITDGATNTASIATYLLVNGCSPNSGVDCAATLCANYSIDSNGNSPCAVPGASNCYDNWFLPAQEQLLCILNNGAAVGNFIENYYWSSTQVDASYASTYLYSFTVPPEYNQKNKFDQLSVRCVSSFTY